MTWLNANINSTRTLATEGTCWSAARVWQRLTERWPGNRRPVRTHSDHEWVFSVSLSDRDDRVFGFAVTPGHKRDIYATMSAFFFSILRLWVWPDIYKAADRSGRWSSTLCSFMQTETFLGGTQVALFSFFFWLVKRTLRWKCLCVCVCVCGANWCSESETVARPFRPSVWQEKKGLFPLEVIHQAARLWNGLKSSHTCRADRKPQTGTHHALFYHAIMHLKLRFISQPIH